MGRQKKAWKRNARGLSTDSLWHDEEPVTNPNPVLHESAGKVRRRPWGDATQEAIERMREALLNDPMPVRDVDTDEE